MMGGQLVIGNKSNDVGFAQFYYGRYGAQNDDPNPHFPLNLNKEKGFSEMSGPCCGMCALVPTTLMKQLFRLPLSFLLSQIILRKSDELNLTKTKNRNN